MEGSFLAWVLNESSCWSLRDFGTGGLSGIPAWFLRLNPLSEILPPSIEYVLWWKLALEICYNGNFFSEDIISSGAPVGTFESFFSRLIGFGVRIPSHTRQCFEVRKPCLKWHGCIPLVGALDPLTCCDKTFALSSFVLFVNFARSLFCKLKLSLSTTYMVTSLKMCRSLLITAWASLDLRTCIYVTPFSLPPTLALPLLLSYPPLLLLLWTIAVVGLEFNCGTG